MARRWIRQGAIAAVAGLWLAGAAVVGAAGHDVEMRDFSFAPRTVTIAPGDRITWVNTGDAPHDATGDGWATPLLAAGQSASVRFTDPGRYPYLCSVHPGLMTGTIVVREPAGGGGGGGGGGGEPTNPPTDTLPAAAPTSGPGVGWSALLVLAGAGGLLVAGRRLARVGVR